MPTIEQVLEEYTTRALAAAAGVPAPALVHPTTNPQFGDYQANGVMAVAKARKLNPRELAQKVTAQLDPAVVPATWEIAGPGFINFRLDPAWLSRTLLAAALDERLGVERVARPETIVVDFSAPNIAKPMHVGHIRSTILGDALARELRFLGHRVITDNHLGDWGTQFGMLLYGYKHFRDEEALRTDPVREMVRLYVKVRQLIDAKEDEEAENAANPIAEACRQETA